MKSCYPKIGIRPIIDGRRRGIRESLEEMTMGLAIRVAELYSETLCYPDGSPVECVIGRYLYRWSERSGQLCRKI